MKLSIPVSEFTVQWIKSKLLFRYNVIPTQGGEKVHALCIDPSTQDVYYSSKNKATIFKTHPSNQKGFNRRVRYKQSTAKPSKRG